MLDRSIVLRGDEFSEATSAIDTSIYGAGPRLIDLIGLSLISVVHSFSEAGAFDTSILKVRPYILERLDRSVPFVSMAI